MADDYSAKPTVKKASPPTKSKKPSPKHKFEGHKHVIWSFVFLHDNKHIVSGSWDGTMRKWDCETGLLIGEPWEGEGGSILVLALSPNGNIVACGRDDGRVQQWNTDGKTIKGV
jgi:WD40 repeat protein